MNVLGVHLPQIQRRQEPRRWRRNLIAVAIASALTLIWSRRRGWQAFTGGETRWRTLEPPSDIRSWRQRLAADNAEPASAPSSSDSAAFAATPDVAQAETTESRPRAATPHQASASQAAANHSMPRNSTPPPTVAAWQDELEGATAQAATAGIASSRSTETRDKAMPPVTTMVANMEKAPVARDVPTPAAATTTPPAEGAGWIHAPADGGCPERFPIKGNANSRIYHRPGEPSYEATNPEICFASEEAAAALGYRPRRR